MVQRKRRVVYWKSATSTSEQALKRQNLTIVSTTVNRSIRKRR